MKKVGIGATPERGNFIVFTKAKPYRKIITFPTNPSIIHKEMLSTIVSAHRSDKYSTEEIPEWLFL